MKVFCYDKIIDYCKKRMPNNEKDRYLEDCIQHVAMEAFDNFKKGVKKVNLEYFYYNFFRSQGLSKNSKQSLKTLANSVSIDKINNDGSDSSYLLHENATYQRHEAEINYKEVLEGLLTSFNVNSKATKWAIENYKHTTKAIRIKEAI